MTTSSFEDCILTLMRVDLRERIAGQPVGELRELLRRGFGFRWSAAHVVKALHIERSKAEQLLAELHGRGYITSAGLIDGVEHWDNTMKGNAFSHASGAKPLLKSSGKQRLGEFLLRVREVGRNPYFLYRVRKAVLFGSYLSSRERINDIDLLVILAPKEKGETQHRLEERRIEEALRGGRSLGSFVDQIGWPQQEVLQYLKARSRSLSLHTDDRILKYGKSRVIYPDRRAARP